MYNLTNSPSGPIGAAGMSSNSTMPQGLTANGPATFNNFGKGIDAFTNNLKDKFDKMFGGLYGGEGNLAEVPPIEQSQRPPNAASIFGTPQNGLSGPQAPQVMGQGQSQGAPTNNPQLQGQTPDAALSILMRDVPGSSAGGALSPFMQGQ